MKRKGNKKKDRERERISEIETKRKRERVEKIERQRDREERKKGVKTR